MGKTIRRYPRGYFRVPRGHKRALSAYENGEVKRWRAVPPDSWDDIRISREASHPKDLAYRYSKDFSRDEVVEFLMRRFGYTHGEACDCCYPGWWTL
jgi:hypothetical protein